MKSRSALRFLKESHSRSPSKPGLEYDDHPVSTRGCRVPHSFAVFWRKDGRHLHQRRLCRLLIRARLAVEMIFELLTKLLNVRNDRHCRRVAQRTEGAPKH